MRKLAIVLATATSLTALPAAAHPVTTAQMKLAAVDPAPEFVTLIAFLSANPIDTSEFFGEPVVNLDGEPIGEIQAIARTSEGGQYYALVSTVERVMDRTPSRFRTALIGVPLDDILLNPEGRSLMMTERGETFLRRNVDERVDIDTLERVETLYSI